MPDLAHSPGVQLRWLLPWTHANHLIVTTIPLKTSFAVSLCIMSMFMSMKIQAEYRNDVDLISLHFDHAPDRDDGHATVADLVVTRHFGIVPHVVSGTYGDGNRDRYVSGAEAVMQITWGNNWLDAHDNWGAAVQFTASVWLNTLNTGGDIYVAEGGQSDFTADVIRLIIQQSSVITTRRITVIQHSLINEANANQSDLSFVKSNTNYIKIKDGNSENLTADLHQPSKTFTARARASYFSDQWNAAFAYLNPRQKLDFSDTVELLYILNIGTDQVANPDDFADVFISSTAPPPLPNLQNQSEGTSTLEGMHQRSPRENTPVTEDEQDRSEAEQESTGHTVSSTTVSDHQHSYLFCRVDLYREGCIWK